jgi:hypothetical protein
METRWRIRTVLSQLYPRIYLFLITNSYRTANWLRYTWWKYLKSIHAHRRKGTTLKKTKYLGNRKKNDVEERHSHTQHL